MSGEVRVLCRNESSDERQLRVSLLGALRAKVPFTHHVWLLVDPETEVGTAPLATVPETVGAMLPALIRHRYATTLNRWDTMTSPVESLHRATGGRPERSILHRELLGPHHVGDMASVVFRDSHGCWAFLELWRHTEDPPFSDRELAALTDCTEPITAALRRCTARSFDSPASTASAPDPAVMFLSPDLRVIGQTPNTDARLRALLPTDTDRRPVPAGAYNVAAALVAANDGVFNHPPTARVRSSGGTWLTFSASRVEPDHPDGHTNSDGTNISVAITVSPPRERLGLYVRAHGLTPREIDVVTNLVEGRDTRATAAALFVSEHTVQDHLKSIFEKTDARNRRTLLARINGC